MDIRVNKSDNTSFGWFYGTHHDAVAIPLKLYPELNQHKAIFRNFVVKPDIDELGPFLNYHFYSLKTGKGFCDFSGDQNALGRYKRHVQIMFDTIHSQKPEVFEIIKHAAKAIHFLQDMTQPHHTLAYKFFLLNLYKKFAGLNVHMEFEKFIRESQDGFFKDLVIKPLTTKPREFDEIFMDNVKFSSTLGLPVAENKESDWIRIGKAGVFQAIDSTSEFLAKLTEILQDARVSI